MNRFGATVAAVAVFLSTTMAFAQQANTSTGGPGARAFYNGHPGFHGGPIILPFVILFALIGFFAVLGFVVRIATRGPRWRGPYRSARGEASSGSALNILEERFARGEIDKVEFEEKRKAIERL